MNTIGSKFFLIILVTTCSLSSDIKADDQYDLSLKVAEMTAPLIAANDFSGAIVLSRQGEIVYQGGFGMANHEAGVAFTPNTASDGGSLAKTFTAAGIQWLAMEGRVDLDKPVNFYIPEYPHAQTTVRHLISHTNGLTPYYEFFDPYFKPTEVRTTEALLKVLAREQKSPTFTPGTQFEYSNFAFDLAALIIERVTKQSYFEFLNQRFFTRLAMKDTIARPARLADWQGVRTMGYKWEKDAWQVVDVFDMEAFLGASNLYFSAVDLAHWANANAAGKAIPTEVFNAGQQRTLINGKPSSITGLSWYCDKTGTRCYYTGSINAFHGFVYWDTQQDISAVFLSNSSLSPWNLINLQLGLVDTLSGKTTQKENIPDFNILKKETYSELTGIYKNETGEIYINTGANGVTLRIDSGLTYDAFQVSDTVLYVPGPDYWLAFSSEHHNKAIYIRSMFFNADARRDNQ